MTGVGPNPRKLAPISESRAFAAYCVFLAGLAALVGLFLYWSCPTTPPAVAVTPAPVRVFQTNTASPSANATAKRTWTGIVDIPSQTHSAGTGSRHWSYREVRGTFIEPAWIGSCSAADAGSSLAPREVATWAGIDGETSKTVEQVGTAVVCYPEPAPAPVPAPGRAQARTPSPGRHSDRQGSIVRYYAWLETYPFEMSPEQLPVAIHPRDRIYVDVRAVSASVFAFKLIDETTGRSWSTRRRTGSPTARDSVEWINETFRNPASTHSSSDSGEDGNADAGMPWISPTRWLRAGYTTASRPSLSIPIIKGLVSTDHTSSSGVVAGGFVLDP